MGTTHVIRGEEWLPSAPLHVLLYQFLGWEDTMPQFAHLPLLLKPSGNGKLSKRDGDKLGFAVFPLEWKDPSTGDISRGYREDGYLPDAFINFLALLGWSSPNEQEIFSLEELTAAFSIEKVSKSGAKFDIEKARWFNQQYLKNKPDAQLGEMLLKELKNAGVASTIEKATQVANQMKERVTHPYELWTEAKYFFIAPSSYDEKTTKKKWTQEAVSILESFQKKILNVADFNAANAKQILESTLEAQETSIGRVMPALRLALTGIGGGPDLMILMEILGAEEVSSRIGKAIAELPMKA